MPLMMLVPTLRLRVPIFSNSYQVESSRKEEKEREPRLPSPSGSQSPQKKVNHLAQRGIAEL